MDLFFLGFFFVAKNIAGISYILSPYGRCVFTGEQVASITKKILSLIRRSVKMCYRGNKQDRKKYRENLND